MKKWKAFLIRLPIYCVLIAVVGFGLWDLWKDIGLPGQLEDVLPTEPPPAEQGTPPEELVDVIVGMGEPVDIYDNTFSGHLELTVNSAKLITKQEECPKEWMIEHTALYAYTEGEDDSGYDHWFLPGGPLERGGKLVQVDATITNVDAVAYVQLGETVDSYGGSRFFYEDDFFVHNFLLHLRDLGEMDSFGNATLFHVEGHNLARKAAQEDDLRTMGTEHMALKIPLGQTVQVSFIFPVSTKPNGKVRDCAYIFGCILSEDPEVPHTYIDLNLEEAA